MPSLPSQQEFHFTISDQGQTALDCLAEQTPLSRQQLKLAMHKGALWITPAAATSRSDNRQHRKHTRRLRRGKKALSVGDQLHLYYNESLLQQTPPVATLIEDAGAFSVWQKPYGMLSQGSKWSDHCTLTRRAEQQLTPERPAFLVHRLDRATSGLMVIGHSKACARALARAFEERQTQKRYQAIVEGQFPEVSITSEEPIDDRTAISHFQRLDFDSLSNRSLIDIQIETGRKHQIRRHLSALGFPIVGDRLHGNALESEINLQLCAYHLSFPDPLDPAAPRRQYNLRQDQKLSLTPSDTQKPSSITK
jgi:tRNA pseudouridine32 synthase / 23S rRNA pseudouridine746 synthase